MDKKTVWSIIFGLLNHALAWVLPLVYVAVEYSFFVETTLGRITFLGIVSALIAFRFFMHRLKAVAENGYGISREMAREARFLLPVFIVLGLLYVIQTNVANLVHVLIVVLALNIPASLFRVLSYRLSRRYDNDTAPKRTLEMMQENQKK